MKSILFWTPIGLFGISLTYYLIAHTILYPRLNMANYVRLDPYLFVHASLFIFFFSCVIFYPVAIKFPKIGLWINLTLSLAIGLGIAVAFFCRNNGELLSDVNWPISTLRMVSKPFWQETKTLELAEKEWGNEKFSKVEWSHHFRTATPFAVDMIKSGMLNGKSKKEIVSLLGEFDVPNLLGKNNKSESEINLIRRFYDERLGYQISFPGPGGRPKQMWFLMLDFDASEKLLNISFETVFDPYDAYFNWKF